MGTEIKRSLASIQEILDIQPIYGADMIEVATVLGWNVVVKKGEFKVSDKVAYFEIDSWIPNRVAPFLTKEGKEPSVYENTRGERLRTIKLRKQISQGLILPLANVGMFEPIIGEKLQVGLDITDKLGIKLYEKEVKTFVGGVAVSTGKSFPSFIPKTDQARVQNIYNKYSESYAEETFEESLKMDGSSCTIYYKSGVFGVCSRNVDLEDPDRVIPVSKFKIFLNKILPFIFKKPVQFKVAPNNFWKIAKEERLHEILPQICNMAGEDYAIQGELVGDGINGNRDKFKGHFLYVFDIFNITTGKYMLPAERRSLINNLNITFGCTLKHVPITNESIQPFKFSLNGLLIEAGGSALNTKNREGVVYKSNRYIDGNIFSFKVINNKYLLEEED